MDDLELLNGWVPYKLLADNNGDVNFRWLYVGNHSFTEPFFEESIASCLSLPQNVPGKFPVTSAETLVRIAEQADSVSHTAFIYHISRCGSTLVAQLLSCDPCNIVLSEVPLLDAILRTTDSLQNDFAREQQYKAVVKLLSRRRNAEQRVFVKTDSWHVLYYRQLNAWYPAVPSFLMYRSPKEVGASQAKHPAMHSVPGVIEPSLFQLEAEEAMNMTRGSYLDHVLGCYFSAYVEILKSNKVSVALSYHDGAMKITEKVFSTCGYFPDEQIITAMQNRVGFHSKNPEKNFSGDMHGPSGWGDFVKSEEMFRKLKEVITHNELKPHEA